MSLLQDTFTDADDTSLNSHAMDVGAGWTAPNWKTLGNKAVGVTTGVLRALADATAGDGVFSVDIALPSANNYNLGVIFRYVDVNNHWIALIQRDAGGTPRLYIKDVTSGSGSAELDPQNLGAVSGTNVTLTVTLSGNSISAAIGAVTSSCDSSVRANATIVGMWQYTDGDYTAGTFDNLLFNATVTIPTGFAGVGNSDPTKIDLSWTDHGGAKSIDYEQVDSGTTFTSPTTTTAAALATSKQITGLTEGSRYISRIKATDAGGDTGYTDTIVVWTLPTAPSGFSMTDNHDPVDYAWTRASTHNEGAVIQTATNAGFSTGVVNHDLPEGTTVETALPLTIGVPVYSRIRNYVDGGAVFSAWVNASNNPQTPRDPLVVTASAGSVTQTGPSEWTVQFDATVTGGATPYQTYTWACTSANSAHAALSNADTEDDASCIFDQPGSYVFELTVEDADDTEATGLVTVRVGVASSPVVISGLGYGFGF